MLSNVELSDSLQGLARAKARDYETQTVNSKIVEEFLQNGWAVDKVNKATTRLRRDKPRGQLLEDRVWSLLYRMGFAALSGKPFAKIEPSTNGGTAQTRVGVVGIDAEIALAIECKSQENFGKRASFQEELGKHRLVRDDFAQAVRKKFSSDFRRQTALAMFLWNVNLSDADRARADAANVALFDEHDLTYYESLVSHLGTAAKYQFFSDLMPGKEVPGLRIRVPAIRQKLGGSHCYTFSISPEYLLKICYVSHRSKGKASDVDAYQRMVAKARLSNIRKYISNNGYFPTSIVVNLDNRRVQFERIKQASEGDEAALLGWLEIRPAYKSAWIIDGQHRLFGYSGHPKAAKARLSVLAFTGLRPSEQARLFIEINSKQKKVSQILLQTLIAELNWDAEDPRVRLSAILSKTVQELDADPNSVFFGRIQTSDDTKDSIRCITITSLLSAMEKSPLHIAKEKQGNVLEYGPLWGGDNHATLKRTAYVLDHWFGLIRDAARDWWDKGADKGGGLAMNDGIGACVGVLRSVFDHFDRKGKKLVRFDSDDLFEIIKPFGKALADYLGSLAEEDRLRFRELRGVQGVTARMRRCQKAIRDKFADFNPDGLEKYLEDEKAQTNTRSKEVIDRIERMLHKVVLEELRREFGEDETGWWIEGVPKTVRLEVGKRYEDDDGKRGGKEHYFDLIHYRKIAMEHWEMFQALLGFGKKAVGKDRGTSWMSDLNEKRKIVAHPASAISLSAEDLAALKEYETMLTSRISGKSDTGEPAPEGAT